MQPAHAARYETGPATGSAADIEPLGIGQQLIPEKDREIVTQHTLGFSKGRALMIGALHRIAEADDSAEEEVVADGYRRGWAAAAR